MANLPKSPEGIIVATENEKIVGKKRKRSASSHDDDEQPAVKYLELSEVFTIDLFSDEVLFEIFKYLDTFTLLALEKTCRRFCGIVQDHRLWFHVNVLAKEQGFATLQEIVKRTHTKTKSVKINGVLGSAFRVRGNQDRQCLLKFLVPKCENLVDLELQNIYVDFLAIKIHDFPKNLRRLVFRDITVRWPDNAPTVFQKMDRSLLWLEELCVESCTWFHPYDIMLFSKCPSLKRLSLRGCQNLSDFVPYGSMAARFGFKALEYLDVRDTPITDSDLQCFNAVLTLKELRLQCPVYLRMMSPDEKPILSTLPVSYMFTPTSLAPSTSSGSSTPASTSSGSSSTSASNSDGSDDSGESAASNANDGSPSTSNQRAPAAPMSNVMMTIDLQNHTRTVILHGRVCEIPESEFRRIPHPDNPQGHFGSLLRHPHFWDMIDRQTGPDCGPCVATKPKMCPITNRGIACFGRPENPIDQNIIWIRIGHRPNDNTFERLSMRFYKRITDDSLRHLMQCSPNLVYLDVTGCGVTQKGIDEFKARKPGCEVVCENLKN